MRRALGIACMGVTWHDSAGQRGYPHHVPACDRL